MLIRSGRVLEEIDRLNAMYESLAVRFVQQEVTPTATPAGPVSVNLGTGSLGLAPAPIGKSSQSVSPASSQIHPTTTQTLDGLSLNPVQQQQAFDTERNVLGRDLPSASGLRS